MISSLREPMNKKNLRRFATNGDLRRCVVDIKRHFDVIARRLEKKIQKIADDVARIAAINTRLS
jgi:hypothetical protein